MESAQWWQRAEGVMIALAAGALALAVGPGWPLWLWLVVALAPDLACLGYFAGPRIGAAIYNAMHLYAGGLALALLGVLSAQPVLIAAGGMWMAHVGFDRALGYGLKLPSGFRDTHMGRIGHD